MILGLDTSTGATAAAVLEEGGGVREARDDPAPGARPQHAARLLELVEEVVDGRWAEVTRVAVGLGPGGFTGLRIGIATARGIAQARGLELAGVSSLRALAAGAGGAALAVIDARRGEAFVAAYDAAGREELAPCALAPEGLAEIAAGRLAVGDGAVRFRAPLERAGARVPPDADPRHRVHAVEICRLGLDAAPAGRDGLIPDYVRAPDATPPQRQP